MTQPNEPAAPAPTVNLAQFMREVEVLLHENMGNRITPALAMGIVMNLQQVMAHRFFPQGPAPQTQGDPP